MLNELFRMVLSGITVAGIGFFIWCWFSFREDRKPHAIYQMSSASFGDRRENEDGKSSLVKERSLKRSA